MKKYMVMSAALCVAMAFTGCKSSESAYKKAYEKAKAQESAQRQDQQPAVVQQPVQQPVVVQQPVQQPVVDNNDNVSVRQERVTIISGNGLRNYSVVVGSFGMKTNAEGLQQRLRDAGYDAQIVKNNERDMYRVVAATYDNKSDAVRSRDQLRATYPDAWLLFNLR